MTPKEKAEQLIDRFSDLVQYDKIYENPILSKQKQCALIAVDEIMQAIRNDQAEDKEAEEIYANYWRKVKTEIEKL